MKKLSKRLFAVAAMTTLASFSIAGCGSSATSGDLPQVQGASRDSSIKDEDGVIKIGIMEDLTGECALLGVQKVHAYQKAIEEINEAGGIDGMPVEMDLVDACSDNTKYQELSRKLILEDKCDVVMGCATSASREAVRPIFEDNNAILFYNNQYEGGVASHNVFCTGLVPEQQVVPLVPTMMETYGKKIYILAADYNFGQITALWFEQEVKNNGGEIVGTEFVPMGTTQFSSTIAKIQDAAPDILVVLAAGSSQTTFFEQWSTSGIKGLPMMTTVNIAQMYEHIQFDPPALANMHVVANYVMELETEDAKAFTEKMKKAFPDDAYFGMEAAASYEGINLYAKAVETAKTTETEAVIAALEEGITLEHMPSGTITMNGDTHHVTKDLVMIRCDENHELHFDASYSQVAPDWLSKTLGINIKESAPNKQYTPLDTN